MRGRPEPTQLLVWAWRYAKPDGLHYGTTENIQTLWWPYCHGHTKSSWPSEHMPNLKDSELDEAAGRLLSYA